MKKTRWGQRWLDLLETHIDPGRLARGRQYLNAHHIDDWTVSGTRIAARIRGKVNPFYGIHEAPLYDTWIDFEPIDHAAWDEALSLIGSRAGYISRLLFNEMPDEIEQPLAELGIHLLPVSADEIDSDCSCPDLVGPCKHVAALCWLLAGRIDQDPFLLFELRGLPRTELIERLRATPLGSALAASLDDVPPAPQPSSSFFTRPAPLPLPDTVSPHAFWRGQRKLPAGVEPPAPAAVSGILIRKGGDFPPFWHKDESFVEVMDALYAQVRKKGKDWL